MKKCIVFRSSDALFSELILPSTLVPEIARPLNPHFCVYRLLGREIELRWDASGIATTHHGCFAGPTVNSLMVMSSGWSIAKATTLAIRSGEIPNLSYTPCI